MAYVEVTRVEIGEVIRRCQAGEGLREIASGTGLSRITVRKYVAAAQELGLSREGPGPSEEQLSRLSGISQSGPRRGGGAGLRPSGSDPRPGDGPPPHGVGPDPGAGLLQAQLRLAHLLQL